MKDKALRQALEFLEQLGENHWGNRPDVIATIKEALAQREWVGLTDDEFDSIDPKISLFQFYKAIEAKLKEKNT